VNGVQANTAGHLRLPDGGQLAYEVHGAQHTSIPLLLIRPLGGTMALWGTFRTRLSQELRVISFDLRASKREGPLLTEHLARDALALLDGLGVSRAHVFGISLGGMAATWLAALAPGRVAKLCLASTPIRGLELSRAGLLRGLGMLACFARPRSHVEPGLVKRTLSHSFVRAHPSEVSRIEQSVRAQSSERADLLRLARAGFAHDARDLVSSIEAPTLVLAGKRDHMLGQPAMRELALAIPGAHFELIDTAGHDLTLEEPVLTAALLCRFLST
jgi:pimeloyl-ACP methyl ester carboxylesterase